MRNGAIAFVRYRGSENLGLQTVDPDGSNARTLISGDVSMNDPAWSPDGTRLVAVGRRFEAGVPHDPFGQLFVIDASGKEIRQITNDASVKLRPAWAPDGYEIVFQRAVGMSGYHLFAVRLDGTGLRQITGPPEPDPLPLTAGGTLLPFAYPSGDVFPPVEEMPAWAPDGTRIAFVRPARLEPRTHPAGSFAHHIWTVAPDGSDMRQLTQGPVHDQDPAWSPAGGHIVFTRWTDDDLVPRPPGAAVSAVRLHVMSADGANVRTVSPEPRTYQDPCWAPDGSRIVFSRSTGGPTSIWTMAVDGSEERALTQPSRDGDYHPTWQPIP